MENELKNAEKKAPKCKKKSTIVQKKRLIIAIVPIKTNTLVDLTCH